MIAEILSKEIGFRVALTVNGHTVIEKKISGTIPTKINEPRHEKPVIGKFWAGKAQTGLLS